MDQFVPMKDALFDLQLRTEKKDWLFYHCSEWVVKDLSIKTIEIKCDNYKKQSK